LGCQVLDLPPQFDPSCIEPLHRAEPSWGLRLPDPNLATATANRTCDDAARRGTLQPNAPYLQNCRSSVLLPSNGTELGHSEGTAFTLNSREISFLLWGTLFLAWGFSRLEVRRSFKAVLGSLFGSALIWVLVAALGYTIVIVALLSRTGYWAPPMTKLVTWWFLGTAVGAVFNKPKRMGSHFRHLVIHNLTLAAAIEFLSELYTFPFAVELIFVPGMAFLVALQAVAQLQTDPKSQLTTRVLNGCASLVGLTLLIFVFYQAIRHSAEVVSPATIKEFLLPLILMAAFIPFLYAWFYVMEMQSALHMTKFGLRDTPGLFAYARLQILKAVGLSLARAQLFEAEYRGRLWNVTTRAEILAVLRDFDANSRKTRLRFADTDEGASIDRS
jgi:hypothetical protein